MKKLELYHFSPLKPFRYLSGYYYVLAKKDHSDLSKVKVANLFYPKEISELDKKNIPYMSFIDSDEEIHSKDFLFGPEVTVEVNVQHLELIFELVNKDNILMWNHDFEILKQMFNLKRQGKDYHLVAKAYKSACLYEIESSDTILVFQSLINLLFSLVLSVT